MLIVVSSVSLVRLVLFFRMVSGCPCLFCRLPQVRLGLWVHSEGGLCSSEDIRATAQGIIGGYGLCGLYIECGLQGTS